MAQPTEKKTRKPAVRNPAFDPTKLSPVVAAPEPIKRKSTGGNAAENPFNEHIARLWAAFKATGKAETLAVTVPDAQAKPVEFKIRQAGRTVGAGTRVQSTSAGRGQTRVSFTVGKPRDSKKK